MLFYNTFKLDLYKDVRLQNVHGIHVYGLNLF